MKLAKDWSENCLEMKACMGAIVGMKPAGCRCCIEGCRISVVRTKDEVSHAPCKHVSCNVSGRLVSRTSQALACHRLGVLSLLNPSRERVARERLARESGRAVGSGERVPMAWRGSANGLRESVLRILGEGVCW